MDIKDNQKLDSHDNPIRTGFYRKGHVDHYHSYYFIDIEKDTYESFGLLDLIIDKKGKISQRHKDYFNTFTRIDVTYVVEDFEKRVKEFRGKLERTTESDNQNHSS